MKDDTPDYARYSLDDLRDVERRVNRDKYPDRYLLIVQEIARRERENPTPEVEPAGPTEYEPGVGFFLIMLVASAFLLFTGFIQDFQPFFASRNWIKTSCVITKSVDEEYDSSKSLHVYEIAYKYNFQNRNYVGERYSLKGNKGRNFYHYSMRSRKENNFARRYPVGFQTMCYVNPQNPSEAVLVRFWPFDMWISLIFGSIFVIVGLRGLHSKLKKPTEAEVY